MEFAPSAGTPPPHIPDSNGFLRPRGESYSEGNRRLIQRLVIIPDC